MVVVVVVLSFEDSVVDPYRVPKRNDNHWSGISMSFKLRFLRFLPPRTVRTAGDTAAMPAKMVGMGLPANVSMSPRRALGGLWVVDP